MTSTPVLYRRILRRETHSPRAVVAMVLAVLLVLVAAWIGLESVLALLGVPPLLVSPAGVLASILALPVAVARPALTTAGVVVALIGLLLILYAVLPGRRANHHGEITRTAMVVDNRVIASVLARRASHAGDVDPDRVVASVGHRHAEVRIRPRSGWVLDREAIDEAVAAEILRLGLVPGLDHTVVIESAGTVEA
ncbi:MAG TPA: hypothetical protein VGC18_00595 [Lacisediminihabitans sp.]|uniref:hypothetical protein n=1 Tax=Lacisediminihabitans sp. TaxID=2787631 RepID=UPI002EDA0DD7